ncbi:MAG: Gfo/Idh/MocA family oxidoreductase [Alphaproteobacteria bacterium]|nr:Gfo/Idh/MocA family oxidoreductase [Alphaproteobacteria bacterium]
MFHADESAFTRARAVLRSGGVLTAVCDGPEEARVPARRVDSFDQVLAASDVVIIGGPDARKYVRAALEAGKHVSLEIPFTFNAKSMLRLAHIAKTQRRLLHLFEPNLYRPAFRTLRGHSDPAAVSEIAVRLSDSEPATSAESCVQQHLSVLQQLVVLGGPVEGVTRAEFRSGRFDATLVFRKGARATVSILPGSMDSRVIEVQSELRWRIEGTHLFCGNSMTTLTDSRSPSELGMLELSMVATGRGRPTLTLEAHYHTLVVLERLAACKTGRLA